MNRSAPTLRRVAAMAVFALSCLGLLLFLWLAFGGPVPLQPKGYRFQVSFPEAATLAREADVRISGVPVGRVKDIEPDGRTGRSDVTIELQSRYAPLPADARAILRQKTLLGETYVELTPGSRRARALPEDGRLAAGQVAPTVELDEILRTFDAPTRAAFQTWMRNQALAIGPHGQDLNDALGTLAPFAEDAARLADVLRTQRGAVRRLVADTGVVFEALTERGTQLRELIRDSNRVLATTASRDRELRAAIRALPAFERESRRTLDRVARFAGTADPLVTQLRPAARELSPTLRDLGAAAPDLQRLFRQLPALVAASRAGFPAAQRVLDDARPLLAQLDPFSRQLTPMLDFLGLYKPELTAFFANTVASTQAKDPGSARHYLRTINPLNLENLAVHPRRLGTNRTNPYAKPGELRHLGGGLRSFETRHCRASVPPTIASTPPASPAPAPAPISPTLLANLQRFVLDRVAGPDGGAPPCRRQGDYTVGGQRTRYPHVRARP